MIESSFYFLITGWYSVIIILDVLPFVLSRDFDMNEHNQKIIVINPDLYSVLSISTLIFIPVFYYCFIYPDFLTGDQQNKTLVALHCFTLLMMIYYIVTRYCFFDREIGRFTLSKHYILLINTTVAWIGVTAIYYIGSS